MEKVAIITGGGRGIGAATARVLHGEGYKLALMSPSGSAAALAKELGGVAVEGTAASADDLARLVEAAMQAFGRVDAVVNHTGHPPKGPLLEISDAAWHEGLDLILLQVVRMCRLVTPIMLKQGGGAIVNVTTFSAFEPDARFPVSSALRAAVSGFAKMYADEYAGRNIRINTVLPGFIDSLKHAAGTAETVPMQRIGRAEELAATIAFLLSDGAGYITGESIRVDGGFTRHV
jgi:NAD(P)-dependent dehydrogenase (short-subunit alcohol dehydrogenase family)